MVGGKRVDIRHWKHLSIAQKQAILRDLYKTGDPKKIDTFLSLIRAPKGYGVYASSGPNYQYAVFGRDSIEVAEDILTIDHTLVREIIIILARLQGKSFSFVNEEEVGKIHHEYRTQSFNGHAVSKAALTVLKRLAPHWGGTKEEMLYYGSFDTTALFIRLVQHYYRFYGGKILERPVLGRDGVERPVGEHVRRAATWLAAKITASPWQLFEYKRLNQAGIRNQSWQDSEVAYLHEDGGIANSDNGIAAIEMQSYAYDALRAAAELVPATSAEADSWRHLASIVRDNTLERLWMPDKNYFAMGLDRNDLGATRQIKTFSINAGLLLESDFLKLVPHHVSWPYVSGIVKTLFSEDFITNAGLRTRALRHAPLMQFADYHGCLVTWPKATYDVAKGLRKHGFYKLATLLEDCLLQAVLEAGEFYEFFFIDTHGRVQYLYKQTNPDEPIFHDFGAANLPDGAQAWTMSAILSIIHQRHTGGVALPTLEEAQQLEETILKQSHIKALQKRLRQD